MHKERIFYNRHIIKSSIIYYVMDIYTHMYFIIVKIVRKDELCSTTGIKTHI